MMVLHPKEWSGQWSNFEASARTIAHILPGAAKPGNCGRRKMERTIGK